jgi:hypothetical protein
MSKVKSSVKDNNIFRGFSVVDINIKHRVSQGFEEMSRISKKTLNRPLREETVNQLFMSDSFSSVIEPSDIDVSFEAKPIVNDKEGTNSASSASNKIKEKEKSIDFNKQVLKKRTRK